MVDSLGIRVVFFRPPKDSYVNSNPADIAMQLITL